MQSRQRERERERTNKRPTQIIRQNYNRCIAMPKEMPISTTTEQPTTNSAKLEQSQCQSIATVASKYCGDTTDVCARSRKLCFRNIEETASIVENNDDDGDNTLVQNFGSEGNEVDYLQFARHAGLNSSFEAESDKGKNFAADLSRQRDFEQEVRLAIERKIATKRISPLGALSVIAEAHNEPDNEALLISTKPTGTSKGFGNTFSLLQQQLQKSTDKSQTLKQSLSANTSLTPSHADEPLPLTRLELELQARERLHTLGEQVNAAMAAEHQHLSFKEQECLVASTPAPPLLSLLYDFSMGKKGVSAIVDDGNQTTSETIRQQHMKVMCATPQENLIYHVSVGADGDKYLRVMRNARSLHDKGRQHLLQRSVLSIA